MNKNEQIKEENLRDINKANFIAVNMELQVQRKKVDDLTDTVKILQNAYSTLQGQFQVFQTQYAVTMQNKINGGPTEIKPVKPNGDNG